jgi:hypothetical protein
MVNSSSELGRLRGKIINAYKSREDKVLANEEVRSMIAAQVNYTKWWFFASANKPQICCNLPI